MTYSCITVCHATTMKTIAIALQPPQTLRFWTEELQPKVQQLCPTFDWWNLQDMTCCSNVPYFPLEIKILMILPYLQPCHSCNHATGMWGRLPRFHYTSSKNGHFDPETKLRDIFMQLVYHWSLPHSRYSYFMLFIYWLVVYLPLWKIWVRRLNIILLNIWKVIIHSCSSHHQPDILFFQWLTID